MPADVATLFGPAGSGDPSGGPCLFEPETDTLFPHNWLRPRFRWNAGAGQNLFELRLHTTAETDDLVVYTASTSWTMPKELWTALTMHAAGTPITMTVRGAQYDNGALVGAPSVGTSGPMTIAPADADGAIVYWTTSNNSALKGFSAGDETVATALVPDQVKMKTVGDAKVSCIGCHTSTPDGKFAAFTAQGPWGNALASVAAATVGDAPSFLGAGAVATLEQYGSLGIQTYSKAHWSAGDHVMVTPFGDGAASNLAWVDLEDHAERDGHVVRVPGAHRRQPRRRRADLEPRRQDHRLRLHRRRVHRPARPGRRRSLRGALQRPPGGAAAPIPGAADPGFEEYYPAFSPDDAAPRVQPDPERQEHVRPAGRRGLRHPRRGRDADARGRQRSVDVRGQDPARA